jgi:hypothetical protein
MKSVKVKAVGMESLPPSARLAILYGMSGQPHDPLAFLDEPTGPPAPPPLPNGASQVPAEQRIKSRAAPSESVDSLSPMIKTGTVLMAVGILGLLFSLFVMPTATPYEDHGAVEHITADDWERIERMHYSYYYKNHLMNDKRDYVVASSACLIAGSVIFGFGTRKD